MAAAPLESSSTPPRETSTEPTRPQHESMEDNDPHSTRKRPRLDSGSGVSDSLKMDEASASRMPDPSEPVPAASDEQEAAASDPPSNQVTINTKSPVSAEMTLESVDTSTVQSGDPPSPDLAEPGMNESTAISLNSTPAQSPEIMVAEVEDMDQDPSSSNWHPLHEAPRDGIAPEAQLQPQVSLTGNFPRVRRQYGLRDNVLEIAAILEKGSHLDEKVFIEVKHWMDDIVTRLDQLTAEAFVEDQDFWEDLPLVSESLLRRDSDFQPDDGQGTWACVEEYFINFARIVLHLLHLDTLVMNLAAENPDRQPLDLMSRNYVVHLRWMTHVSGIPFFQQMERIYGVDVPNMVARINDRIAAPPLDGFQRFTEFVRSAMDLLPRWQHLVSHLDAILMVVNQMADSGRERILYHVVDELIDTSPYKQTLRDAYELAREVDKEYRIHVTKKSSWLTSDASEVFLRCISNIYHAVGLRDPAHTSQIAKDLSIEPPEAATPEDCAAILLYGWKFDLLKKHIMDGRMELRVLGMETMQTDLVTVWKQFFSSTPDGIDHPVVQYLLGFLRTNKIVEYLLGLDSHPQLISRSSNVVGFLVATSTYTNVDTDTIWNTVVESQDFRTVAEVLHMLTRTFNLHEAAGLIYLCSKLLQFPLTRFDARMLEYSDLLLSSVRAKHEEKARHQLYELHHVDAIPVQLCVRLIRESSAEDLPVEQKAGLQRFAGSQLSNFIQAGLSEADKMETYERCIQDVAEMNQFTVGSLQALHALLPSHDTQEIRRLATDFDLTRLVINEITNALDATRNHFADPFSRTGLHARVQILARIIDKIPDTITPDLVDALWDKVFTAGGLTDYAKRALWDMLCTVTGRCSQPNPFIEHCAQVCLPQLSPRDYSPEVLAFAKQTIWYEVRFSHLPVAAEKEVIQIPGMSRIWKFILTAPVGSIEDDATSFAIEMYLDHQLIRRSPSSAAEATHVDLVNRCVEQLQAAAAHLKSGDQNAISDQDEQMTTPTDSETAPEELRFSRSLLFLRQLLHGLRARPQYSPPQGPPPDLPSRPLKGEAVDIQYQVFVGGTGSKLRSFQIGDLSTSRELSDKLVRVTGFSKFITIWGGGKIDLLENPDVTVKESKIDSALLIVRKADDSHEISSGRQSLSLVDSEVFKHFDSLYDLLSLEDHLAREIYDFLSVFPPQERILELVRSEEKNEDDLFAMEKPYCFLYSVDALSSCLREEAMEPSANQKFVTHSIQVLTAALTRPEMSESIQDSPRKLRYASSLVQCFLLALTVKPTSDGDRSVISDPSPLVQRLLSLIEMARHLPTTHLSQVEIYKLICDSFAILIVASVRDQGFWDTTKQHSQLDQLLVSLFLEESRQGVRANVAETIIAACSPPQPPKPIKSSNAEPQESTSVVENPLKADILSSFWDAFVLALPRTPDYVEQSREFFQVALFVFRSTMEKSPRGPQFDEYLKQWAGIMLDHRTAEFPGREPVDHLLLGFLQLIKACLDVSEFHDISLDTFDLAENLWDRYLFPDLTVSLRNPIVPQVPVMHAQTRQVLYETISTLSKCHLTYSKMVERLDDLIPREEALSPNWCPDRYKMIRSPQGYAGLKNLSNTCYMNSLLTQLFMNVGFREFILQANIADPKSSQRLLDETKNLFGYMQETWIKWADPEALVDTIRTYENEAIDVTIQMDVDEFYNLLFDRWEAQILDPEDKKRFRSFYGGQLVQQIKSKECDHISEREEPFSAIQCEIKGKATLEESLQAYVEGEIMQGDNKYSCTSCGRHVDAVKRACLKDVPDNLIFHLKRFDFDMVSMMRSKINDEFQFPDQIDMSPFKVEYLSDQNKTIEPDVFQLVGVLVHSGTAESGHYYSYIRERPTADSTGSWVEFNDADVSRFDPSRIPDQCFGGSNGHQPGFGPTRFNRVWNAYMLFYQRSSSMESVKSVYKPDRSDIPIRVPLPVSLGNHIAMENEVFIRTFCLLDPYHVLFVRYVLDRLHEAVSSGLKLDRDVLFIAMDTLEQLLSKTKDPLRPDVFAAKIISAINDLPKGAYRVVQWAGDRRLGLRNLILRSPHAHVRDYAIGIFINALSKLRGWQTDSELEEDEQELWRSRYQDGLEDVVSALDDLWWDLQSISRPWDDYFDFLRLISNLGIYEVGVLLRHGFLSKCLEIISLDRDDLQRFKRYYVNYCKLVEKGRRPSHRRLLDLLFVLLSHVDFSAAPTPREDERTPQDGKYPLSIQESSMVRLLSPEGELVLLKRILEHHSNPQTCSQIVALLLDAPLEAGLLKPICNVLESGLRVEPAALCAPYLDATIVFCRQTRDEERILGLIDFVAKGVDSIQNSGGREHLTFFTTVMTLQNQAAELDETWFSSRVIEKIPDWATPLLLYPERSIRGLTLEVLRRILFTKESPQSEVARELVQACVERLKKIYLTGHKQTVESRAVETITGVITHCLENFYGDSQEDEGFVQYSQQVLSSIQESTVEVPEDAASVSDVPSPDEWEDNSMASNDSDVGLIGTP